jgi:hypothetical protein
VIIPLPTIFLASLIEKAPKDDLYIVDIIHFGIGRIQFGIWLKYRSLKP